MSRLSTNCYSRHIYGLAAVRLAPHFRWHTPVRLEQLSSAPGGQEGNISKTRRNSARIYDIWDVPQACLVSGDSDRDTREELLSDAKVEIVVIKPTVDQKQETKPSLGLLLTAPHGICSSTSRLPPFMSCPSHDISRRS